MINFRNLMGLSTAIFIAMAYGTSTTAQNLSPSENSPPNLESQNPSAGTDKTLEDKVNSFAAQSQELSQSNSGSGENPQVKPVPGNIDSSANPLLFPTNPNQVEIKNVQPITLNQAIEIALKNGLVPNNVGRTGTLSSTLTTRSLKDARLALEQAQAQLEAARADLYPSLQTSFELNRNSSPIIQQQNELAVQRGLPGNQNENSTNALGRIELNYNIYTGGRRSARIESAERSVTRARLEVEVWSEETRYLVTQAYYELQRADAQVAIAQAAVEDSSQSLRDAQLLYEAGLGTRFSVLQAEVDVARASQELTQSIANQRVARRQLAQILNIGQRVELTAADEISEAGKWQIPLDQSIVMAYKNRAELEQQLVEKEINQQDSLIALSEIKPQVDFFANYIYQDNFDDTVGVADGYTFGTRVTWTFFDGGRAFAQARRAYREMERRDTDFAQIRDQIREQVESAYFNLIANQENIQTAAKNVETATESLRLARLRFQAGVGTQTDVINSQRDLTDARSRFLQAIIDYNQSLNTLQRAVSNLPDNQLFEHR